ncbi:MAG: protein kinase [Planctomycetota bacterium]
MGNTSTSSSDDCETIDVLASDFLARYRDGERPTVEEYARRHPEYGDSIRRMFPLVASIERIKINEQVDSDGSATLAGRVLTQLGDFRIIREIGRGGMGIVFEAHQESLDRTVAIKVLPKQSLLDDEALERFRTEATTAAAMHHTNIVPIYGTGESEGSHYLVMQLVNGESLDSVIASHSEISSADAACIGHQVADAIAYSHANGVLHRDIKPGNILIEENGTAQVTDFGLAKFVGTDLTGTHSVSGSLRYMAPERFSGISDQRSDVYAVGITLYELLTGKPVFHESDAEHLIGSITHPRLQPLRAIRPDVPTDLETIVSKAIHVDPNQRYQSAIDLRDDLGRFLADEPIHARKTSVFGRLIRWSRRNPKLAIAITVAAFALLLATLVSTIAYAMTSAANRRSSIALQSSERTVDIALQSLDGVVEVVSGSPASSGVAISDSFDEDSLPNVSIEPTPVAANILERLQPTYERLSQQSPTRPDIIVQMVDASIQLARIQHLLGRIPEGIKTLDSSVALLHQRERSASIPHDELHLRLARLNNELGVLHAAEFHHDASSKSYELAIESASRIDDSHIGGQVELARAHLSLGYRPPNLRRTESSSDVSNNVESNPAESKVSDFSHVNLAIDILEKLDDSRNQSSTKSILYARSLLARSRLTTSPREKRDDLQRAIALLRDQLAETPDDTNVRFELVATLADVNVRGLRSQVRLREADERLREALGEISRVRSRNPDNSVFLVSEVHLRHKLSAIARTQSRLGDANTMVGEAIRLQTALVETFPDSVRHRCWRAMLYRSQATINRRSGNPEAAQNAIENAKRDLDSIGEESLDHPLVVRTREAVSEFTSESDT